MKRFLLKGAFLAVFTLLLTTPVCVYGAAYQHLSPLINTPKVATFKPGDVEVFGAMAVANNPSDNIAAVELDMDFQFNYAVTDKLKVGVTLFHENQAAANIHATVFNGNFFGLAMGMTNLTNNKNISSRNEFPGVQENNYSSYLVTRTNLIIFDLHLGIGDRGFRSSINQIEASTGFFGGIERPALGGTFIIEHDGKNLNFGFSFKDDNSSVHVAATEAFVQTTQNDEYNEAPIRFLTMGFSYRQHLSNYYGSQKDEVDLYKKEFADLKTELVGLKQRHEDELDHIKNARLLLEAEIEAFSAKIDNYLDDLKHKGKVATPTQNIENETQRYVLKLYNMSFDKYLEKDYFKAIAYLSEAIELRPEAAFLYIRLGSIYYEMDREDLARESWETALKYDADNKELIDLLSQ